MIVISRYLGRTGNSLLRHTPPAVSGSLIIIADYDEKSRENSSKIENFPGKPKHPGRKINTSQC